MLAKVLITQVHRYSCTFFSHVPCYVREHTVEEHSLTHSLTHIRVCLCICSRTYTRKKKKLTHVCIVGDKIAYLHIQMSFPHVFHIFLEFPTFYPHSHIFLEFPTFYPQSFPHFSGVSHILFI